MRKLMMPFVICALLFFSALPCLGVRVNPIFKAKAVNLGSWLVAEGWITPSLFDGIPNKDCLFKSVTVGKYLCAENGGRSIVVANRSSASNWETFSLSRINENTFNFRVFNKQFVGNSNENQVIAISNTPGMPETFEIIRKSDDPNRVKIKASNGMFLQVKKEQLVMADYSGEGGWRDNDPSVFVTTVARSMRGEFQVTNGIGHEKAPQVMREHWSTYIVEDYFKFMSANAINAVRIPVWWWIAKEPVPPTPFVGCSLLTQDNAFTWAETHGVMVIVDLHAALGSQNGYEHSASSNS